MTNTHLKTCIISNEKFDFLHDLLEKVPEIEPEKVEKRGRPRRANSKDSKESPIRSISPSVNNNNNNTNNDTNPDSSSDAKRGRGRPKKDKTQPLVGEEEPPAVPNIFPVTQPNLQTVTLPMNIPMQNNFGFHAEFPQPVNFANISQTPFGASLHHPNSNTEDVDYDEED